MLSFLPQFTWIPQRELSIDEAIERYVIKRDKRSFERIYQAYAKDIYHFLASLSDETLAKDISQKTWLKLIESPNGFQINSNLKAWLFKVARNLLIDEIRKQQKCVVNDELVHHQTATFVNDLSALSNNSDQKELHNFNKALQKLSFEQKEAFCLQQEGFSLKDIAVMTHTKQETIKTRLRYAKTNLIKLMVDQNEQ